MTDPTPDHFFVVERSTSTRQSAARAEWQTVRVERPTVPEVREADLAVLRRLIARYGAERLRQLITALAAETR